MKEITVVICERKDLLTSEPEAFFFGNIYENRIEIANAIKHTHLTPKEISKHNLSVETYKVSDSEIRDTAKATYEAFCEAECEENGMVGDPSEVIDPRVELKYEAIPNAYRITDALGNTYEWSTEFYRQAEYDDIFEPYEVLAELASDLRSSCLCVVDDIDCDSVLTLDQTRNLALAVEDDAQRIKDLNEARADD